MKQSTALDILKTGQNVFLTGQAGAGKTYVLNQYIHYLRVREVAVAITASTGIAATHMGGMTIHSWSGMGIKDSFTSDDFKRLKSRRQLVERLKDTKVLIIDEISMLHAKQVELLDEILRTLREDERAFGGVQVVFSGDFFQLPPVGSRGESNKEKFAFMAKAWVAANFQICYLSEQHRQAGSDESLRFGISLNDILNQIRAQDVSQFAFDTLLSTKAHDIGASFTQLYTHNASVDKINEEELGKLTSEPHTFDCTTSGDKILVETLKKNVRATESLTLKVGAKVMFVKNNPNLNVFNGTMGEVVDFATLPQISLDDKTTDTSKKYPVIRLNTGRTVIAEPEEWAIEDNQGEVLASYHQVPLCLAWAITIHKSQGMTLDAAQIDLSRTFETGQGYVALSRLRSLDGLRLLGMSKNSLLLDEWVFHIDRRLLTLAREHEEKFNSLDTDTLHAIHEKFIEVSDGTTSPTAIARNEKILTAAQKSAAKRQHIMANEPKVKTPVGQTLLDTKALVEKGLSLVEIATERQLAKSTIIEHITKLIEKDGVADYMRFAPTQRELDEIQAAFDKLESQGEFAEKIQLRPIVEELSGRYDYNAVRLALAFINKHKETEPAQGQDKEPDA